MCRHSGRGWKHTRWRPAHSGVPHNPWHSCRWRSLRCWRTDRHVRKGWSLLMKRNKNGPFWIRSGAEVQFYTCLGSVTHRCYTHLYQCCRCCQCILKGSCSWTSHWWGWCHTWSPPYRDYWYRHHQGGTAGLSGARHCKRIVEKATIWKRWWQKVLKISGVLEAYLSFRRGRDRQKMQRGRRTWSQNYMLPWRSHRCSQSSQTRSSHSHTHTDSCQSDCCRSLRSGRCLAAGGTRLRLLCSVGLWTEM